MKDETQTQETEHKDGIGGYIVQLILLAGIVIYVVAHLGENDSSDQENMMQEFQKEKTIVCSTFMFKYSPELLVSKSRGWSVYNTVKVVRGEDIIDLGACKLPGDQK